MSIRLTKIEKLILEGKLSPDVYGSDPDELFLKELNVLFEGKKKKINKSGLQDKKANGKLNLNFIKKPVPTEKVEKLVGWGEKHKAKVPKKAKRK